MVAKAKMRAEMGTRISVRVWLYDLFAIASCWAFAANCPRVTNELLGPDCWSRMLYWATRLVMSAPELSAARSASKVPRAVGDGEFCPSVELSQNVEARRMVATMMNGVEGWRSILLLAGLLDTFILLEVLS